MSRPRTFRSHPTRVGVAGETEAGSNKPKSQRAETSWIASANSYEAEIEPMTDRR